MNHPSQIMYYLLILLCKIYCRSTLNPNVNYCLDQETTSVTPNLLWCPDYSVYNLHLSCERQKKTQIWKLTLQETPWSVQFWFFLLRPFLWLIPCIPHLIKLPRTLLIKLNDKTKISHLKFLITLLELYFINILCTLE